MSNKRALWGLVCLVGSFSFACRAASAITPPTIAPAQTAAATAILQEAATPSPPADSGWQVVHPGLEQRIIRLFAESGRQREQITVFRLDPTLYDFQVAYRPGEPQTLTAWQAETDALLVVNGGFFTEQFFATGLTVIEGQVRGSSYGDFAGMFAVTDQGPSVRWLGSRPYNANEPLRFGLQSFPMLVKPGGIVGYERADNDQARRTVIAQDGDGRILILVAPWGSFTLQGLSQWLVQSDLNLDVALNLDGGTSTGLLLTQPELEIPSFVTLPIVITVQAK